MKFEPMPVNRRGQFERNWLQQHLPQAALICTMVVNNETGVVHDFDVLHDIIKTISNRPLWMADCVQAWGKVELNLNALPIDYGTFSGHKLYAPKGIGFLFRRKSAPFTPLIVGGGQESGLRSGTENLPGVAALGAMIHQMKSFHSDETLLEFRDALCSELSDAFPHILWNAPQEVCVPTTLNFAIPELESKEILDLFDAAGLRISAGSACNSKSKLSSHVLEAMGIPEDQRYSSVRLSFGPATERSEIERGILAIRAAGRAFQRSCLLGSAAFQPPRGLNQGLIQFRTDDLNSWFWLQKEKTTQPVCIIVDPTEARCRTTGELCSLSKHSCRRYF